MSTTQTPHLGLIKPTPGTGEYADVSVINGNMDKLDAAIGEVDVTTDGSLQSQIDGIQESVSSLTESVDSLFTIRLVETTINKSLGSGASITAPTVSGYKFICWIEVATIGWIASVYPAAAADPTSNVYVAANQGASTGTGTIRGNALYVKDV